MHYIFTGQSYVQFYFDLLGLTVALVLPLSGLVAFVLTLLLVNRGKGISVGPALILIVPLPMYIGLFAALNILLGILPPIPKLNYEPRLGELAFTYWAAEYAIRAGMLWSIPAYLTAVIGTTVRSFRGS